MTGALVLGGGLACEGLILCGLLMAVPAFY